MQPPYQQSGGGTPIEVGFAGPAPQRRVTVLFRIFLAIPQVIVLYILGIAADIVAIIGWFGALFTGRLPQFAAEFLSGVLRWQARVNAYTLLLTDQYPPFALDDVDYPVRVVTSRGQLNRLAVFFRFILAIPAVIVVGVLTYGTYTIVLFVAWLIVLITGRMPESLHFAISAVLRYSLRYIGYVFLLTAEYPSGLFGDQPGPGDLYGTAPYPSAGYPAAGYPQAGPGYPPARGFPSAAGFPPSPAQPTAEGSQGITGGETYQQVSGAGPAPAPGQEAPTSAWGEPAPPGSAAPYGTPPPSGYGTSPAGSYGAPPPGYGTAPAGGYGVQPGQGYGAPAPRYGMPTTGWLVPGGPPWRLVLSQSSKRLVTFFIVLGVLVMAVYIAIVVVVVSNASTNTVSRAVALSETTAAFGKLNTAVGKFGSQMTACSSSSTPLRCLTAADQGAGQAFGDFAREQSDIAMPAGAPQNANRQLVAQVSRAQHVFQRLASSNSRAQYLRISSSSGIQQILHQIEQAYQRLGDALANRS